MASLDLKPRELRRLEVVVAAPHSRLRATDDQTRGMVTAIGTPGVQSSVIPADESSGHGSGIRADWGVVFAAAAKCGVAIEIDGDPSRQDIDFMLAGHAVGLGCLFALDSDAHSVAELSYVDTASRSASRGRSHAPESSIAGRGEADGWLAKAWDR